MDVYKYMWTYIYILTCSKILTDSFRNTHTTHNTGREEWVLISDLNLYTHTHTHTHTQQAGREEWVLISDLNLLRWNYMFCTRQFWVDLLGIIPWQVCMFMFVDVHARTRFEILELYMNICVHLYARANTHTHLHTHINMHTVSCLGCIMFICGLSTTKKIHRVNAQ